MTDTLTVLDVARLGELLQRWIGYEPRGTIPARLAEILPARAQACGKSIADYLDELPPDRLHGAEAQALVDALTNGLTAFWRDPAQLEALASLLGQLHTRHRRPLNVWCAGCATGEEAYSVSIAAAEVGVPVEVLGTDVNTRFLEEAQRAQFDEWALRRVDAARRDRWFAAREGHWILRESVTGSVRFAHHNLLDPPPSPPAGSWDAILCRNVVIYLAPTAVRRILVAFAAVIAADGYLVLGSSEQIGGGGALFRAVRSGPAFVYCPVSVAPGDSFPITSRSDAGERPLDAIDGDGTPD